MRAVCDTGPLLHLTEAEALDALQWIDEVHAPLQVVAEMLDNLAGWQVPAWITIHALDEVHAQEASAWLGAELLHAGEAEAIALARQLRCDWLLTDDAAARLFAGDLGLEVHGSLGIILWCAANGYFDYIQATDALSRLASSSLWLSRRILAEARAALVEIYRPVSPSKTD